MRTSAYAVLGALLLSALTWAHFTGWSPGVDEVKNVPTSVRESPGSYRAIYRGPRSYTGAK